jgi:hypothetical protein
MNKKIDSLLPKALIENIEFLEGLYQFLTESSKHASVPENLKAILAKYNATIEPGPEFSLFSLSSRQGVERQMDHLHILFNKRKYLLVLIENLPSCKEILEKALSDNSFYEELKNELDNILFEDPSPSDLLTDLFVRMKGFCLGAYRRKKDWDQA